MTDKEDNGAQAAPDWEALYLKAVIAHERILMPLDGGNPYPPHPGTRIGCYRCSLPGLTGFTTYRCEGTDTGYH